MIDPSGHETAFEVAAVGGATRPALVQFIKSLAVSGLAYCTVYDEKCREINSGKIHAQGKTFGRDAGTGVSVKWSQEIPPLGSQGFAMLGALWVQLSGKNQ